MRIIITTTGTSVTGGTVRLNAGMKPEDYRRQVAQRVAEVRQSAGSAFLDAVSAETKSLKALNVKDADAVFLLHTDTEDGLICAELVADILRRDMNLEATLKRVVGLQVQDATAFRRKGIDHLFQILKELTAAAEFQPDQEVILNITGGFKSVVPYVTLFGQLRRFDVAYIFEQSASLIRLPPLPVQYDFARVGQALEAIRRLRLEGVMRKDDFMALIPGLEFHDRRLYECLLDEDGESVTLSAIAEHLLVARDEERQAVMLHPHARAALEGAAGAVSRDQFIFMLERVSDPLWRDSKRHVFKGTDLEVYKPGNTPQRLAGFSQGREFYACELYGDHNVYERDLVRRLRSQYKTADFVRWVPPADVAIPETDEELAVQQQQRLAASETNARKAEAKALENEQLWESAQSERDALKETLNQAQALVAQLQQDLAAARRPWWKKLFQRREVGRAP